MSDRQGPRVWQKVEELHFDIVRGYDPSKAYPLPPENRGSWYCPCVTKADADALDELLTERGVNTVYDLGAGDFRFAAYMAALGYDVVAYETLETLIDAGGRVFDLSEVDIRQADYYAAFDTISPDANAAFCAWGKTNKLPAVPSEGVAVEGPSWRDATVTVDGVEQ
jgi:SAM-dependent methyltransferase